MILIHYLFVNITRLLAPSQQGLPYLLPAPAHRLAHSRSSGMVPQADLEIHCTSCCILVIGMYVCATSCPCILHITKAGIVSYYLLFVGFPQHLAHAYYIVGAQKNTY